jgi:hypothetical protein
MGENKGLPKKGNEDRADRSYNEGAEEQILRQGVQREGAKQGRDDVTDEEAGVDGILQKGVGGYGADPDAVGPARSDKPLTDNGEG